MREAGKASDSGVEINLTPLTQQVRALYEDSAVPVAEIARLAGVHQRTLYKYVRKGGWRRRHATQDIAAAMTKRAAKRKPRPCVTAKGAGGRFIRGEDVGAPFARGMKALDPAGEARALSLCERAAALSEEALARTRRLREAMSDARTMATMMRVVRDLAAIEDGEDAAGVPAREKPDKPRRARRKEWRAIGERPLWADRRE